MPAPTPEAAVCNRSLARIGQLQTITDLLDKSVVARACNTEFADARDEVLEARPWPFAMRRASLASVANLTRNIDGWLFAYPLPDDCVTPRYIHNPALQATVDPADAMLLDPVQSQTALPVDIPFIKEDGAPDVSGSILLTNQAAPAVLVYTARVALGVWTRHAVNALVYKMASVLALSVAKKPQLAQAMDGKFEWALARAAREFNNQKPAPRPMSVFERNR